VNLREPAQVVVPDHVLPRLEGCIVVGWWNFHHHTELHIIQRGRCWHRDAPDVVTTRVVRHVRLNKLTAMDRERYGLGDMRRAMKYLGTDDYTSKITILKWGTDAEAD